MTGQARAWRMLAGGAVGAVALGLLARGCWLRPGTTHPGAHYNRDANAIWLGVEWVNEPRAEGEVAALAGRLARQGIRHVFVFTTYRRLDGRFNPTYAHAAELTRGLHAARPKLEVQAWVGLPLRQRRPFAGSPSGADLGDAATREGIAAFCAGLVEQGGFDGLHLDPEPARNGDAGLLALLREVHARMDPSHTLSVATPRTLFALSGAPLAKEYSWGAGYYREVAGCVDQLAVMTYDSALPLPLLYRQWARFQVIAISRAVDRTGAGLFFGVPTSEESTWTHRPGAENMGSGLQGVIDGLNDAQARPEAVTGVAIYPEWETDAGEWATYGALWLGG